MNLTVYLAREIHSDWRDRIVRGLELGGLPVTVLSPVTDHPASDGMGVEIPLAA